MIFLRVQSTSPEKKMLQPFFKMYWGLDSDLPTFCEKYKLEILKQKKVTVHELGNMVFGEES